MLAQFALVVVAIFGVMALVIDLGSVTLARVQMQNAADSAALQGLRDRDRGISPLFPSDAFQSDCIRRSAARNVVSWTFDDNFDLGSDPLQLGAGGAIAFTDSGISDPALNASQTFDLQNSGVYKPALERNQTMNATHGDMVSGRFVPVVGREADDYSRPDFTPGAAVVPGASGLPGCPVDDDFTSVPFSGTARIDVTDDAFLVRLRRTGDRDPLANNAGISSRGSALPLLFARGTSIEVAAGGYSARRDGLMVRATAIAAVRPAMQVGVRDWTSLPPIVQIRLGEQTAVFYAVSKPCWDQLRSGVPVDVSVGVAATVTDGVITAAPSSCAVEGGVFGRFQDEMGPPFGPPRRVGDRILPSVVPCVADGTCPLIGFGAIYQTLSSGDRVIVGFGRVIIDSDPPGSPVTIPEIGSVNITLALASQHIAEQNASARLPEGLTPATALTPAVIASILAANQSLRASGGLLAPVLVR